MRAPARILSGLAVAAALAGGLAACTSAGESELQRIGGLMRRAVAGPEPAAPRAELGRAELDRIPFATIALSLGEGPRTFIVPLADNGGYLNYLDANRRGVVMFGGAVTSTQALGQDLVAVRHDRRDPIAHPTPLAEWPGQVYRDYQFRRREGADYRITLACVFERVAAETIEIVELSFDLVRVSETCTNAARQVTNTYWVDADSGFIWKSVQWLGPYIGQATVEIIRPYGG